MLTSAEKFDITGLVVIAILVLLGYVMCSGPSGDGSSNTASQNAYLICQAIENAAEDMSIRSVSDCSVDTSTKAIDIVIPMSIGEALKFCHAMSDVIDTFAPRVGPVMRAEDWKVRIMTVDSTPTPVATCRL